MKKIAENRGQVILIILLITTIGLTIGLSLVSRTISDIKVSTQITESSKAFSAAESGIEAALKGTSVGGGGSLNLSGTTANFAVSEYGNSSEPLVFKDVVSGDTRTIWLVKHNDDGGFDNPPDTAGKYDSETIEICWGSKILGEDPPTIPAIETTLLYYESGYKIGIAAFDISASSRDNNFDDSAVKTGNSQKRCGSENRRYNVLLNFNSDFDAGGTRIALMVKPLYAEKTDIAFGAHPSGGDVEFPSQGKQIISTGTTTSGAARKISVIQGYASIPSIFGYTIFTTN